MTTAVQLQSSVAEGEAEVDEVVVPNEATDDVTGTGAEESTSEIEENEWTDLLSEDDSEEPTLTEEAAEEGEVTATDDKAPSEEVPGAKTPDETPEVVEETKPVKEPEPVEEIKPEVVPEEVKETAEEETQAFEAARTKARDQIKEKFALTEEQEDLLVQSPNKVLPGIVADLYLDLFDSIMGGFQQQIPGMIRQVIQRDQVQTEQADAFYGAWPQLNKTEYQPTVDRIAQNYRTLNPQASSEDAIKEIGAHAWVALRLPLEDLAVQAGSGTTTVETPAATPRKPAGRGSAGTVTEVLKPKTDNAFTQLADEFLEEDL